MRWFALCVLIWPFAANASPKGRVSGVVLDGRTDAPLRSVAITCLDCEPHTGASAGDGAWSVKSQNAEVAILFAKKEFIAQEQAFSIASGKATKVKPIKLRHESSIPSASATQVKEDIAAAVRIARVFGEYGYAAHFLKVVRGSHPDVPDLKEQEARVTLYALINSRERTKVAKIPEVASLLTPAGKEKAVAWAKTTKPETTASFVRLRADALADHPEGRKFIRDEATQAILGFYEEEYAGAQSTHARELQPLE